MKKQSAIINLKEKIKLSSFVSPFDIILLGLGILSTVAMIQIEFKVGFTIQPSGLKNIILALSYSFIGSIIFYLVNIYLPTLLKRKHYFNIVEMKIADLSSVKLKQLYEKLLCYGKFQVFSIESLNESLKKGDIQRNINHVDFLLKRIVTSCEEILVISQYIDPELLTFIERLRHESSSIYLEHFLGNEANETDQLIARIFESFETIIELNDDIRNKYDSRNITI